MIAANSSVASHLICYLLLSLAHTLSLSILRAHTHTHTYKYVQTHTHTYVLISGVWAPRKIENPHYFEDKEPSKIAAIGGLAVEVWTTNAGINFDNFVITRR